MYISRIWGEETPQQIEPIFFLVKDIHDVIKHAKFGDDCLRGSGVVAGQILAFPIDFAGRPYNTLTLPCERVIKVHISPVSISLVSICPHTVKQHPWYVANCNLNQTSHFSLPITHGYMVKHTKTGSSGSRRCQKLEKLLLL